MTELTELKDLPDLSPEEMFEVISKERKIYFDKMAEAVTKGDEREAHIQALYLRGTSYARDILELMLRIEKLEDRLAVNDGR